MTVNEDVCEHFGLDPKRVASLARRLGRAARDASSMGLTVFGNSGNGHLTITKEREHYSIAAINGGSCDGGDAEFSEMPQ